MQNNSITSQTDIANVTVVTEENQIIVPQPITNVIEVNNPGPRGPQGTPGVIPNTGSFATTGSNIFTGNQTITGSLSTSGSVYVNGNKQFNYGAFSSSQTQIGLRNSILSMSFNTTDVGGSGVSLVDSTKLRVENTGIYNLQFSAQLDRSTSGTNIVTIWFAYTGSSIANSATDVTITGGAAANPLVASWNYILPMSASSYVEIYWSHDDNADDKIELKAVTTRINPPRPAVPSVIATLTQIS